MLRRSGKLMSSALTTFLVFGVLFSKCGGSVKALFPIPYNLKEPDRQYVLKKNLSEVSGLSLVSSNQAVLVQDEAGVLFYFDLGSGNVVKKLQFGKRGDYEDVQVAGDTAYVLRSDGLLYELSHFSNGASPAVRTFPTGLTAANNTEGLCYDERRHRLLIACKDRAGLEKKKKHERAVYSFDLNDKTLSDTPVVRINVNELEKMADGPGFNAIQRIIRYYQGMQQQDFKPSGLAINPKTQELYVISSVGNMLIVMDSTAKLQHSVRLSPYMFKQPEGIAFDTAGNLYVSNEGRKGKGNILKFSLVKK